MPKVSFDSIYNYLESASIPEILVTLQELAKENKNRIPLPPIRSLAAQGGGAKGVLYTGVISGLDEYNGLKGIKLAVGSSAGAISAFIIGLGFSGAQFKTILTTLEFTDLFDRRKSLFGDRYAGSTVSKIGDVLTQGYAYSGDNFQNWAENLLEQILGDPYASFRDLETTIKDKGDPILKRMAFTATNIETKETQYYSYQTTPDIRIADALHASMSFPSAYAPVPIRYKDGAIFATSVDGGVLDNYPIDVLSILAKAINKRYPATCVTDNAIPSLTNPAGLGLSLTALENLDPEITPISHELQEQQNKKEPKENKKPGIFDRIRNKFYTSADLLEILFLSKKGKKKPEDLEREHKAHAQSTLQIYTQDIPTLNFKLTSDEKKEAHKGGLEALLSWWSYRRQPTAKYTGSYNDLAKDYDPKNLHKLINAFIAELQQYQEHSLPILKGYDSTNLGSNVRLTFLAKQILNSLKQNYHNGDISEKFELAFTQAQELDQLKDEVIQKQIQEREKLLTIEGVTNKLVEFIETDNIESFTRMLTAQMSQGLIMLQEPLYSHGNSTLTDIAASQKDIRFTQAIETYVRQTNIQLKQNGRTPPQAYNPLYEQSLVQNSPEQIELSDQSMLIDVPRKASMSG